MTILNIPFEYWLFALTLVGIAFLHHRALLVSLIGFVAVVSLQIIVSPLPLGPATNQIIEHFSEEWVILSNLLLLLLGFAMLSNQFERSLLPEAIPLWLPDGWKGGVCLLAFVFLLSTFLDNIAGAIIGGVAARHVFPRGVTVAYLAAIVSAANAGGAGSVIGDTTTTMMWISGIGPLEVLPAFIGGAVAFLVFAPFAAIKQEREAPFVRQPHYGVRFDWARIWIVLFILATLVTVNVVTNSIFPSHEEVLPALGLGLWTALLASAIIRSPEWSVLREALPGSLFLVTLVALASLMPLDDLPRPSLLTILGLGFLSAVFDNIPLTALAINQGGYDWSLLAYAVGFGGSMVWFGSSAGVALTNLLPHGRSVFKWLRDGWFVPLSYVAGFLAMVTAASV